ncbi:MAG: hypothetical protein A3E25_06780 [Burkholderiales bacterium RIFCSPHIGHO2_12_FULL_69_20]|nr:MAG: hypothetical protein A3E25_06780 [Burkholderiales bacterium RIFCSPHIGHO2_12_FULL_69_20]
MLDRQPRRLQVSLAFDPGNRSHTTLRLPGGWAALDELTSAAGDASATGPRARPVPGAPTLRSVDHAPGARVQLHWRLTLDAATGLGGSAQAGAGWFAFSGQGVLAMPDELDQRSAPSACVQLDGLGAGSRWASSHGSGEGSTALLRVAPGAAPLAERVQQALYAGGALQAHTLSANGSTLTAVMPADAGWRFEVAALAQASAEALATQRRFWAEREPAPPWLVLMLPGPAAPAGLDSAGGTAWLQALALQAPTDLPLPGAAFDALIRQALARAWLADRFGPLAHAGRGDEAMRAWFSEGWADFLAHRSLLREGRWTPDDYATALNRKLMAYLIAPERALPQAQWLAAATTQPALAALPVARGEWLALQWHQALSRAGQPGLEALMRRLLVPPALARREGPISAPLATHRLVAALRAVLDDRPLRDIHRHIEQGEVFAFGPGSLGPCFIGQTARVPSWRLGFEPASLLSRVVAGVQPGGPAEAAGLRDGMRLLGHSLVPGEPTQPVWLQVQAEDGSRQEIRYLPGGDPVHELPRYQPVPQAMEQSACLGWLGLGPQAGAVAAGARSAGKGKAQGARKTGAKKASTRSTGKASGKAGSKAGGRSSGKAGVKGVAPLRRR